MTSSIKTLSVDEKWSIVYDEAQENRILQIRKYGKIMYWGAPDNFTLAVFYALLESRKKKKKAKSPITRV